MFVGLVKVLKDGIVLQFEPAGYSFHEETQRKSQHRPNNCKG